MVLKPAVTRLAAMAAIAPEPATFQRARHAVDKIRAKRLTIELSFPPSFLYLSAGAAEMPGQSFHGSISCFPSLIGEIPPTSDLCSTEDLRAVHRCLSFKVDWRPVTAAGRGRVLQDCDSSIPFTCANRPFPHLNTFVANVR